MPIDIPGKLLEAVRALRKSYNLDKLSVRMLTDYCGISRQTFYYYFDSLEDFFAYANQMGFEDVLRRCRKAGGAQRALTLYFDDILVYYDGIEKRLCGEARRQEEENIRVSAGAFVREWVKYFPGYEALGHAEMDFLVEFFADGIASVIIWHGGDSRLNTEQVSGRITALMVAYLGAETI